MSNLKVDAIQDNAGSGIAISSPLTVSAALVASDLFTSQGIDDNATGIKLTVADTATENVKVTGDLKVTNDVAVANNAAITGTLTVSGAFTSDGIDDNSTGTTGITIASGGGVTVENTAAFQSTVDVSGAVTLGSTLTATGLTTVEALTINGAVTGMPTIVAWWRGTVTNGASGVGLIDSHTDVSQTTGLVSSIASNKLVITYPEITANPCIQVTNLGNVNVESDTIVDTDTVVTISFPELLDETIDVHIMIIKGDI
jgi:hypothetical protein